MGGNRAAARSALSFAGVAKILFCEDNPTIIKLIRVAMRESGHEVFFADDGASGLRSARSLKPDLLVTDLAMPNVNGLELYDAIRADPVLGSLPIAFLTASTQRNLVVEARARAPIAILAKPFSPAGLRADLDRILASRG